MTSLLADFMKAMGTLTEILFLAAVFNYVIKGINKKYRKQIQASNYKNYFNTLMKLTVKNHKLIGLAAIMCGLIHGLYELNATEYNVGIVYVLAGVVTLSCFIILGMFGIYGFKIMKSKRGNWFHAHRLIAAVAVVGLLIHVLLQG